MTGAKEPSGFERFARLYGPAPPGEPARISTAGRSWSLPRLPAAFEGLTIWGDIPLRGVGSIRANAVHAARREAALARLRAQHGRRLAQVHRLRVPPRTSRIPKPIRAFLRGGLLVELGPGGHERTNDDVVRDAQLAESLPALYARGDGAAVGVVGHRDGSEVVLRVRMQDDEPANQNAAALAALEAAGVSLVPRLVAGSTSGGASWTTETRMAGEGEPIPDDRVVADVVAFCASLPQQTRPTTVTERLSAIARHYPERAAVLRELADRPIPAPGILQHGDLWTNNLLVDGGRLSAVIDWETWHPAGVPGVDILQLVAMQRRARTHESFGALWSAGVSRSPEFLALAAPYWAAIGVEPSSELLDAVALDWWSGIVVRHRRLASRPAWAAENVERVLRELEEAP